METNDLVREYQVQIKENNKVLGRYKRLLSDIEAVVERLGRWEGYDWFVNPTRSSDQK